MRERGRARIGLESERRESNLEDWSSLASSPPIQREGELSVQT
jgi:hypothetical protein